MAFKAIRWFQVLHILFPNFKIAHNGRSHLMMNKMVKDKRRAERLDFDQLKQEKEAYEEMKHEIQDLREQLKMHQRNDKDDSKHTDILNKLFKMGKKIIRKAIPCKCEFIFNTSCTLILLLSYRVQREVFLFTLHTP